MSRLLLSSGEQMYPISGYSFSQLCPTVCDLCPWREECMYYWITKSVEEEER
jgi:hypothetical protein